MVHVHGYDYRFDKTNAYKIMNQNKDSKCLLLSFDNTVKHCNVKINDTFSEVNYLIPLNFYIPCFEGLE